MSHFKQKLLLPSNSFSRAIMCLICFFNNLSKKTKQKKNKACRILFLFNFSSLFFSSQQNWTDEENANLPKCKFIMKKAVRNAYCILTYS